MTARGRVVMLLSNPFEPDVRVLKEARSLVAEGYEVTILCWDRLAQFAAEDEKDCIRIRRIQIRSSYGGGIHQLWNFLRFNLTLTLRLMREEMDVVHCHDLDTLPGGFLASRLRRKALVYDEHETEYFTRLPGVLRQLFRRLERFLARRADLILVTNLIQVRKIQSMVGKEKSPMEIKNCPPRSFFHAPVRQDKRKVTLGWIGYIQHGTGIDRLITLFDQLAEEYAELELLLVGKIHPTFQEELESHLHAVRHFSRIRLVAAVPYDQVYPYYRQLDIAALFYEDMTQYRLNTPTKLFEAMAHGIPVVATAIGDVEEIVQSHACGYIVGFGDEEQMRKRLEALIVDPDLRMQLGHNGYHAAGQFYNWELMASRLAESYHQLF